MSVKRVRILFNALVLPRLRTISGRRWQRQLLGVVRASSTHTVHFFLDHYTDNHSLTETDPTLLDKVQRCFKLLHLSEANKMAMQDGETLQRTNYSAPSSSIAL